MRARMLTIAVPALALVCAAAGASASTHALPSVSCPLKGTTPPPSPNVQWAFTESGPPSGAHPGLTSSYTHGRGSWSGGRASGTICNADSGTGQARDIVLAVAGGAHLAPGVVRLGLPGVALTLPLRVSASDDPACAVGTRGTATLFASYHSVHHDSVQLSLASGCVGHDHRFTGAALHVLIDRHGRQVNSASLR